MTTLLAIILGIIQGLTEFLPISSSGHLALFGKWFGLTEADLNFDIILHLATLIAILIVYRKDTIQIIRIPFSRDRGSIRLFLLLVLATIPAALIGLAFKDQLMFFHNHIEWVALFLSLTGLILLSGFFFKNDGNKEVSGLTVYKVLGLGFAQALAILPGISRSGMTIMMGMALGMKKEEAARFSFLMAIPAISGAGVLMARDLRWDQMADLWAPYLLGFVFAFISSLAALKLIVFIIRGKRFFAFGFYCITLALIALLVGF